jgi:hypothetical protein
MDSFTKRIIAAMAHGISIEHGDGHRWICPQPSVHDFELFEDMHSLTGIYPSGKVYGSVADALDIIDAMLAHLGRQSLEEYYDTVIAKNSGEEHFRITGKFDSADAIEDRYFRPLGFDEGCCERTVTDDMS